MLTLEFNYKGKLRKAKFSNKEKHLSPPDYILEVENGYSLYYFLKEDDKWLLAYGSLPDDLRDSIIEALILRFETI